MEIASNEDSDCVVCYATHNAVLTNTIDRTRRFESSYRGSGITLKCRKTATQRFGATRKTWKHDDVNSVLHIHYNLQISNQKRPLHRHDGLLKDGEWEFIITEWPFFCSVHRKEQENRGVIDVDGADDSNLFVYLRHPQRAIQLILQAG